MWRNSKDSNRAWASVSEECESFLDGSYLVQLAARNKPVPGWVWMNRLAHAERAEIEALADGTDATMAALPGRVQWHGAVSFLATEVLGVVAASQRSLRQVQRDVLVPLELSLAAENRRRWLGPDYVVSRTLAALHNHPSVSL
jgi:hypothetical protein